MADKIIVEPIVHNIEIIKQVNEVSVSSPGPQGQKGSSILTSPGLPSNSLGRDGDYYLDSVSDILYGPKVSGSWPPTGILLRGLTGETGAKGDTGYSIYTGDSVPSNTLGNNGDIYIISSNNAIYKKSGGAWQTPETLVAKTNWSYVHEQQTNQTVWNITHNLGYRPSASIIDYGSNNVEADINFVDVNSLTITFSTPMSGYAYLS
jgi:hypothetical protein